MRTNRLVPVLFVLTVLAVSVANVDLITGRSTPFYRDLGTTQRPARALYEELGSASLNPHASFGQAYWGNPNLLLAYPFPRSPRFLGLHLLLHLGVGLWGAYAFFRHLGRSAEAAYLGALAFALSGYVVSSTAFVNATTTLAWLPWLLAGVCALRKAQGRAFVFRVTSVAGVTALLVLGGEPALGAIALFLAGLVALGGPAETRRRSLGGFLAGGSVAALLIAPWIIEVLKVSAFSSRRLRGFSWSEFAAVAFHPARFVETLFPLVLGDPSHVLSGAFWGFSFTQGNPPYLASLSLGLVPFSLALVFVLSARRNEGRIWIAVGTVSLLAAMAPWLPGAKALYEALPPLHVLRYPIKAMLAFTLSAAALAALATDRLLIEGALPRFRRRVSWFLAGSGLLLVSSSLLLRLSPGVSRAILLEAWNPAWRSDSSTVLGPILEGLPLQAARAGVALALLGFLFGRGAADSRGRVLLLLAVSVELLVNSRHLLPRVPASWYVTPSPLVLEAAKLSGRVFERTGKNVDAVRRGLFGRVPLDDGSALAVEQWLQGWALTGSPHGLRYAYDPDPDGSYGLLNRIATDVVVSRDWGRRIKWLRAAGVTGLIAHDVPPDLPGVVPVFVEERAGVPTTLYRLTNPLPGIRRLSRVSGSGSVTEAVQTFERTDFDPATDVVVSGPRPGSDLGIPDTTAQVHVIADGPETLSIETNGSTPAVLHVDRSYTPRVTATVDGREAKALAADLHLIGVPVPAGPSRVEIRLAP